MKKKLSILFMLVFVIIFVLVKIQVNKPAVFATSAKSTTKTISTIKVNNKTIYLKDKSYLQNKLVYLPISIMKSIGGKTGYKNGKQVLFYKNLSVAVNTGNIYATIGKVKVYLGGPVECNKSGTIFVPSALFAKVFLVKIKISRATIYITTTKLKKLPIPKMSLKPSPKPTLVTKPTKKPSPAPIGNLFSVKVNGKTIAFDKDKPAMVRGLECLPALDVLKALGLNADYKTGSLTTTTIEGKSITLVESSGLFDYNGTAYMPYQAFEQLLTTADWFDENRMVVINAYVKRKVWTHVNCFEADLLTEGTIWQQVDIFQRLMQSGNYERKYYTDYRKAWYKNEELYAPRDHNALFILFDSSVKTSTAEMPLYFSNNGVGLKVPLRVHTSDIRILVEQTGFGEYTRHKIREILKMAYPDNYVEAYTDMMKVLRQELWVSQDMNDDDPSLRDWYIDSRTLSIYLNRSYTKDGIIKLCITISPYGMQVDDITPHIEQLGHNSGSWGKPYTFKSWMDIVKKYGLNDE